MLAFFKTIGGLLTSLFSFGQQVAKNKELKIPMQEAGIKEKSETTVVRQEIRQDGLKDRELKTEPKQLLEFSGDQETDYLKQCAGKWVLYFGDRIDILKRIKRDEGRAMTNDQERKLRRDVHDSKCKWFIIRVHPLTIHEESPEIK